MYTYKAQGKVIGKAMATVFSNEAPPSVMERMRPEVGAGGFSRFDGTLQFFLRVSALLRPDMTVVDLGAGRGASYEESSPWRRSILVMKGRVREVIGLDIDPVVAENPTLDRYYVIEPGGTLPLESSSVDMIVSDWTLEHVDDPEPFAAEVTRVLKPGGWLCARTPRKWSVTGLFARLVPNALHTHVLRFVQPTRKSQDVFPVRYRMNTPADLKRLFPPSLWRDCSFSWKGDPSYYAENAAMWRLTTLVFHLMPNAMANSFMIFLQKKA